MQRLKLFGGVSIETEDGPLTGRAVQRRRLSLLALLGAAHPGGMSRDRVVDYLWPEAEGENGRRFLSDSVYRINDALGGDVIVAAADEIRLNTERLPSDLIEFEEALARGDRERAVAAYSGPFLDGFFLSGAREFERWIDGERDRLARSYAAALEALAESAELECAVSGAAVAWWRKLAVHDPYNSRVALRLMQSLDRAGERAAAIQHARVHETMLAHELEIELDPAIRGFVEELRSAPSAPTNLTPTPTTGPKSETKTSPDVALEEPLVVGPSTAIAPTVMSSIPLAPRRIRQRGVAFVGVFTAVAALIAVAMVARASRNSRPPTPTPAVAVATSPRTIAVLPFENLSADRHNQYLSDGMTEELITALGRLKGVGVASRTSVFALKGAALDVREIGRRLGVGSVVEGSVRKSGSRIRIAVQLVNTSTGYTVWSDEYDRELADEFAIERDVSHAIVTNLIGALAGDGSGPLAKSSTPESPELVATNPFHPERASEKTHLLTEILRLDRRLAK